MHYRNGREAKPGDKVMHLPTGQGGVLYDLNADAGTCNARVAVVSPNNAYVTVGECVHLDDVAAAFPPVPSP